MRIAGKEYRDVNAFYKSGRWLRVRAHVLQLDHHECQRCKDRGRLTTATTVHHVKHLRDRPDLALSLVDPEDGTRQLVSLCASCHDEVHPEKRFKRGPEAGPKKVINAEWW